MQIQIIKGLLLIFWAIFLYSLLQPFNQSIQPVLFWVGIVLAVIHLLEFFIQYKKLAAVNAAGFNGFVQTLLFGMAYWLPQLRRSNQTGKD